MNIEANLGSLLGKSSRLLANNLNNSLREVNLTVEQWSMLALLWSKDNQTQKSLQETLLKNKATINSLVSYLIKDNFITKRVSPTDKRSAIVSLTKKGKEMKNHTIPIAINSILLATEGINKQELQTTFKVLEQIINNLAKDKK